MNELRDQLLGGDAGVRKPRKPEECSGAKWGSPVGNVTIEDWMFNNIQEKHGETILSTILIQEHNGGVGMALVSEYWMHRSVLR